MATYTTILTSSKLTEVSQKSNYKDVKSIMYVLRNTNATVTIINKETGKGFWAISSGGKIVFKKIIGLTNAEYDASAKKAAERYEEEKKQMVEYNR